MKTRLATLAALALVCAAVIAPAVASAAMPAHVVVRPLTSPTWVEELAGDDRYVAWSGYPPEGYHGKYAVEIIDTYTTARTRVANEGVVWGLDVEGNHVAWSRGSSVTVRDMASGASTTVTGDGDLQSEPRLSSNRLVWIDLHVDLLPDRLDVRSDLECLELDTGHRHTLRSIPGEVDMIALDGDRIAWIDGEYFALGDQRIVVYDLSSETTVAEIPSRSNTWGCFELELSNPYVVWTEDGSAGGRDVSSAECVDLTSHEQTTLASLTNGSCSVSTHGGLAVVSALPSQGASTLTLVDPESGTRRRLATSPDVFDFPSFAGRSVIWADRGIYRATFHDSLPTRVSASDPSALSVAAARRGFGDFTGVTDAVVVCGESRASADALTASGLCGAYDAPLLLTRTASLPTTVAAAIAAMPDGVRLHIVGGTSSVSSAVATSLASVPGVAGVDRIGGKDRFQVAEAVSREMSAVLGSEMSTSAIVVNGADPAKFFDALAVSPVAYRTHMPILLVSATSVPRATSRALAYLETDRVYIAGGTGTVSETVRRTLHAASADRMWGADRYRTARAVAYRAVNDGWLEPSSAGVTGGMTEALVGGAYMGHAGGPLLITTPKTLSSSVSFYLRGHRDDVTDMFVFGSTGVVSTHALESMAVATFGGNP